MTALEEALRARVERYATPRPLGSEGNAEVRRRVYEDLLALGYLVSVRGRSRNVLARRPGPGRERALVVAHLDSVSGTPGADDNASGLAVMLAAAEVAPAGALFVATDGEEAGLLGSRELALEGAGLRRPPQEQRGAPRGGAPGHRKRNGAAQ